MKYIPGHEFAVTKKLRGLELGESYKIYHIVPSEDRVKYTFVTKNGTVDFEFESITEAEQVINKASGVK